MWGFVKKAGSAVRDFVKENVKTVAAVAVVAVAGGSSAFAVDPVTIPVIGVSVQDYISAGITLMGTVAGTAVGGYAAFLVVRKGLRWLGKALG